MQPDELFKKQLTEWQAGLTHLLQECRMRFMSAADLLEISNSEIRRIRDAKEVDLSVLIHFYETLCSRYSREVYIPQIDLFASGDPLDLWRRYYYHDLIPELVASNAVVRNVLKATKILPSHSIDAAQIELDEYAKSYIFDPRER